MEQTSNPEHRQTAYDLRMDWGLPGADRIASGTELAVVVDVLSFTTTVSVALDLGTAVLPYRWNDGEAAAFAQEHDAALAVGRSAAGPGQISLSPATLRTAGTPPARVVLPSPNGSTVSHHLVSQGAVVIAASLRNAEAVVRWIAAEHPSPTRVAVVAAGELSYDGTMRPAIEDLWGAGAVVAGLMAAGWTSRSPEAELAALGYEAVRGRELDVLAACASGRELVAAGCPRDVEIAAEAGSSDAVPVLQDGCFAPPPGGAGSGG
jgi:2-phosphosulfolactate phosphatase